MDKKKIIMIAGPVLLILAVAAFMFLKPKPAKPDTKKLANTPAVTYTMADPFVVNLADSERRFAKVGIALEVSKLSAKLIPVSEGAKPVKAEMDAELRDIIIAVLQSKTAAELGVSKGREEVKETIKERINKETEVKITEVFFTEFAVQ